MANKTRATFQKREKEKARQQKQREKEARRAATKNRPATEVGSEGEDPDIAGIRPGPQPLPEEWNSAQDKEE